jgi:hypothetical protein
MLYGVEIDLAGLDMDCLMSLLSCTTDEEIEECYHLGRAMPPEYLEHAPLNIPKDDVPSVNNDEYVQPEQAVQPAEPGAEQQAEVARAEEPPAQERLEADLGVARRTWTPEEMFNEVHGG